MASPPTAHQPANLPSTDTKHHTRRLPFRVYSPGTLGMGKEGTRRDARWRGFFLAFLVDFFGVVDKLGIRPTQAQLTTASACACSCSTRFGESPCMPGCLSRCNLFVAPSDKTRVDLTEWVGRREAGQCSAAGSLTDPSEPWHCTPYSALRRTHSTAVARPIS